MKIFYGSDLHLEFEKNPEHSIRYIPNGDLLLLAGDIFTPWDKSLFHSDLVRGFFSEITEKFDQVILIAGNHEHYNGRFIETDDKIRSIVRDFENIKFLNDEFFQYGDILIFGSTFWTDFRDSHPEIMWDVRRNMNDFSQILYSVDAGRKVKLVPADLVNANHYAREQYNKFLQIISEQNLKGIVLSHHHPSFDCVMNEYRMKTLSYAFANTGLDDILYDGPKHIWVCGHMHKRDVVSVGKTNIYTNARGYIGYESHKFVSEFEFKQLPYEDL